MGCAVTAKRSLRALLRLQRETHSTAGLHGHTAGTHRRHPPQHWGGEGSSGKPSKEVEEGSEQGTRPGRS